MNSPEEQDVLHSLDALTAVGSTSDEMVAAILATVPDACFCFAIDGNGSPIQMQCPIHDRGTQ